MWASGHVHQIRSMEFHPRHTEWVEKSEAGDRVLKDDESALLPDEVQEVTGTGMQFSIRADLLGLCRRRVRDAGRMLRCPNRLRPAWAQTGTRESTAGRRGTGSAKTRRAEAAQESVLALIQDRPRQGHSRRRRYPETGAGLGET